MSIPQYFASPFPIHTNLPVFAGATDIQLTLTQDNAPDTVLYPVEGSVTDNSAMFIIPAEAALNWDARRPLHAQIIHTDSTGYKQHSQINCYTVDKILGRGERT